jgi:hypothetical protein
MSKLMINIIVLLNLGVSTGCMIHGKQKTYIPTTVTYVSEVPGPGCCK